MTRYEHVYYLLIARDHWRWVEPEDGIAIVAFEAFAEALRTGAGLHEIVERLLDYKWLPVEGRDFCVRDDRTSLNSASIDSPVFYAIP